MTSSIFPLATTHPAIGFVSGIVVTEGGSGFTEPPVVELVGTNTTQATAVAILEAGVTSVTVTDGGSGYVSVPPTVVFTGGGFTSVATAIAVIDGQVTGLTLTNSGTAYQDPVIEISGGGGSGATAIVTSIADVTGAILAIALTSGGTGYTSAPTVIIHESNQFGGGLGAIATAGFTQLVSAVNITSEGAGYTSAPTVALTGGDGSLATATAAITNHVLSVAIIDPGSGYASNPFVKFTSTSGTGAAATASINHTLAAGTNIFEPALAITSELVKPGGGGIVRLSFSFKFATTPATVSILNNGILKGNLNADNSANVIDDGYYRFDIDVEAGDNINLQASANITLIHFIRTHLVQFGA